MKAALITAPGRLEIAEIPAPVPNPYQALVRMDVCGVCSATDRKLWQASAPFAPEYPSLFGHEGVGTVVELGGSVRNYAPGDRVLRPCGVYPGQRAGAVASAWGSQCEFALVTDLAAWREAEPEGEWTRFGYARMQQKVPASMTPEEACLLITWKETYSALLLAGEVAGKDVAVLGDGAVGLSFAAWSVALGARSTVVVGRRSGRLARALRVGATATINMREGGSFAGGRDFDIVVDTLGTDQAIADSLPRLRPHGKFLIYGLGSSFQTAFDRSLGPAIWSYVQANPDEPGVHEEVIARLQNKPFDPSIWITSRLPLTRLEEAFSHLESPDSMKVISVIHE